MKKMTDEKKKAKLRAMRILTKRDKTEHELRESLKKAGFSREAVQEALEYVTSFGYVDDQNYAVRYVECYKERKSRQRIRFDLSKRGVERDLVEEALEGCEDFDEIGALRRSLRKKWPGEEKPDEKNLARLAGYLSRQGFSSHDIWQVLREENLT